MFGCYSTICKSAFSIIKTVTEICTCSIKFPISSLWGRASSGTADNNGIIFVCSLRFLVVVVIDLLELGDDLVEVGHPANVGVNILLVPEYIGTISSIHF